MTISAVTSGSVYVGMALTGGTLSGSATIVSFGTFNGTSGTVNLSIAQTFANPTTVTGNYSVANYPAITVKGIVYLDGTYYVMDLNGSIYGSGINNPLGWSALNVIQSNAEPDGGVALFRQLNLIVAFQTTSTEFFYDAANPVGSPLLPYASAFIEVGCASGNSVAQTENTLFFMGVTKQKGRAIYKLDGTKSKMVSNPFIDRLLNADDLSNVSAFCVRISGHTFYVLYLGNTQQTLVFDSTSQLWGKWTVSALSATKTVSAATWLGGTATLTITGHGFNDGDLTTIAGITPIGYNGAFTINTIDANTITYPLATSQTNLTVSGTAANYVQTPFNMASYTSGNNLDLVQDSTTGFVFVLDNGTYQDNGNPIEVLIRTFKFDAGNNNKKFTSQLEIIGDKVTSNAYIRYTNDDYQTYSKFRPVNLGAQRSLINRLGQTRRRAYEIRHHSNTPLRLESLETTVTEGSL